MPNSNQNITVSLNCASQFFVPHKDADAHHAQDVIHQLVESTKNLATATFNCFDEGAELAVRDDIVANLIHDIQTRLELIEKLLPMAFSDGGEV
ncbi:hypothetical protein MKI79_06870 [Acinetobacter sp. A3.8]|uniref:Uncharacterized protein n=1 Tax=Acinetobacter sedimenti TaxID=2919922 RepID=A0A9X1WWU2_9GAMM|nr:hypothetical protein [Acinetobacter sedimenti]MCJ8146624.1 hypothetical protein [Acinetobacter sedimenti]